MAPQLATPAFSYADRAKQGRPLAVPSSLPISTSLPVEPAPDPPENPNLTSKSHNPPSAPDQASSEVSTASNGPPPIPNGVAATPTKAWSVPRNVVRHPSPKKENLNLADQSNWPEVSKAASTGAKSSGEGTKDLTPMIPSIPKKEKTKWVKMAPTELQAAADAQRPPHSQSSTRAQSTRPSRAGDPSRTPSHSTSQSHSSQSLSQSERSSPRQGNRGRKLPDESSTSRRSSSKPYSTGHSPIPPPYPLPSPSSFAKASSPRNSSLTRKKHRPSPSQSEPVDGWPDIPSPSTRSHNKLFGFGSILPGGNTIPSDTASLSLPLVGLGLDVEAHPEHELNEGREVILKQRGKIGIGIDSPTQPNGTGPTAGANEKDDDGWFVVDMNAQAVNGRGRQWEFGRFSSPSREIDSATGPGASQGEGRSKGSSRRSSFGESHQGGAFGVLRPNGVSGYGHAGGREGTGRGRSRGRGGLSRGGSTRGGYGNPQNYHSRLSSSNPNSPYAPPSSLPPLSADPYGPQPYFVSSPAFLPPAPFGPAPYVPYGTVPPGMAPAPLPLAGGQPGAVPPPIPTPITYPGFPLDPLRWYLLGQVEYYFSIQNLCTDIFLRKQMDSQGWIDIAMIASFNRVRTLTTDASLVRDTMVISSLVEVSDEGRGDKVRLVNHGWVPFVLPDAPPTSLGGGGTGQSETEEHGRDGERDESTEGSIANTTSSATATTIATNATTPRENLSVAGMSSASPYDGEHEDGKYGESVAQGNAMPSDSQMVLRNPHI